MGKGKRVKGRGTVKRSFKNLPESTKQALYNDGQTYWTSEKGRGKVATTSINSEDISVYSIRIECALCKRPVEKVNTEIVDYDSAIRVTAYCHGRAEYKTFTNRELRQLQKGPIFRWLAFEEDARRIKEADKMPKGTYSGTPTKPDEFSLYELEKALEKLRLESGLGPQEKIMNMIVNFAAKTNISMDEAANIFMKGYQDGFIGPEIIDKMKVMGEAGGAAENELKKQVEKNAITFGTGVQWEGIMEKFWKDSFLKKFIAVDPAADDTDKEVTGSIEFGRNAKIEFDAKKTPAGKTYKRKKKKSKRSLDL